MYKSFLPLTIFYKKNNILKCIQMHFNILFKMSLYWAAGVHNAKSFVSLYCISKEFNIPPLSDKCALI